MKISADFTVIPDDFAKAAAPEYFNGGVPVVSFPFYIDDVDPEARYLHWEFVDPDSIPVCGFEWIHWSVANLPIDALMYDFNDSHALAIPPDFSRQLPVIMRYNGPQPPDKDHEYYLQVWATKKPLPGLNQGFWLNELLHALRNSGEVPDTDGIFLTGKA